METQNLKKDGGPYKTDTEEVTCPDCGVMQKVSVMAQEYQNNPTYYFVERECPVCGFDGVWF